MSDMRSVSLLLGGDYDRTRSLVDGSVQADGVELRVDVHPKQSPHDTFHQLMFSRDYDGGEMSLSFFSTLMSKQGKDSEFIALPVFVSRMFRHGNILVNESAGISGPEDLNGRTIGIPEYGLTMGVWARGLLMADFGLDPTSVRWRTGRDPAALEADIVKYPDGVDIRRLGEQANQMKMLAAGEFDAYIGAAPTAGVQGVRRLFPNYTELEKDYYKRTRAFPIMHLIVIRRSLVDADPSLAQRIIDAFTTAKNRAIDALRSRAFQRVTLPWLLASLESQEELMDGDLWPYGLKANADTLSLFLRYAWDQGLLWRRIDYDELFVPDSL